VALLVPENQFRVKAVTVLANWSSGCKKQGGKQCDGEKFALT
jgi:hypothetical protein